MLYIRVEKFDMIKKFEIFWNSTIPETCLYEQGCVMALFRSSKTKKFSRFPVTSNLTTYV